MKPVIRHLRTTVLRQDRLRAALLLLFAVFGPAHADLSNISEAAPPTSENAATQEIIENWWRRIGGMLMSHGVPEDVAKRVFLELTTDDPVATGPGSWVYEFKSAGDVYYDEAKKLEVSGRTEVLAEAYDRATGFYDVARFPALFTKERQEAYALQLETFLKLAALRGIDFDVVSIPFEGKQIIGHFYHNPENGRAPLIIWSGGLDTWKTARPEFKQRLVAEGFAVFAMDMPGTGESQHVKEVNSDRIYSRVIDYFQDSDAVDGKRIGLYCISFSGVFALKLALTNPAVDAAVNHSGGIALYYTNPRPAPTTSAQRLSAAARNHAIGAPLDTDPATVMPKFSLERQGLLKKTPGQAPIMNIYGTEDVLMPIADYRLFATTGIESEDLIYEGATHMAWEHQDDLRARSIAFLKRHLGVTSSGSAGSAARPAVRQAAAARTPEAGARSE